MLLFYSRAGPQLTLQPRLSGKTYLKSIICWTRRSFRTSITSCFEACAGLPDRNRRPVTTCGCIVVDNGHLSISLALSRLKAKLTWLYQR
jgi:hypothetical protein